MNLWQNIRDLITYHPPAEKQQVMRKRWLMAIAALGTALFTLIGTRVMVLALTETSQGYQRTTQIDVALRGNIFDRNGRILATSLPAFEIYANPSEVIDRKATAKTLAELLPNANYQTILAKLNRDKKYTEIEWKASPRAYDEVLKKGLVGIYGKKRISRFYPQKYQVAHVLGVTNKDSIGIAGVEASFNKTLAQGNDLHLSIDLEIQAILRRAITEQITQFEAIGGAGVILDITNGEILALVSLPDYDPNAYSYASKDALFNRATRGVYELGSVFKILNTAMAIDSGVFTADTIIDVVTPLRVGRFSISDFHPEKKPLTVAEVLIVSSNKGSARIAHELGAKTQKQYISALGLTERVKLNIPEDADPILPKRWKNAETMTIAYGHGLSVTPVHLASAVATATGTGVKVNPTLVKGGVTSPVLEQVFKPETTKQIRAMIRRVVSHKRGTGSKANAEGYVVGGKTGTAEKQNAQGEYSESANIASFVGVFPAHAPRFVVMVMVDEPIGQKSSYNYATGGWVAAPAVSRFITHAAPLLKIAPVDENTTEISRILHLNLPNLDEKEGSHASF